MTIDKIRAKGNDINPVASKVPKAPHDWSLANNDDLAIYAPYIFDCINVAKEAAYTPNLENPNVFRIKEKTWQMNPGIAKIAHPNF